MKRPFLPVQAPGQPPRFTAIGADWFGQESETRPSFRVVLGPDGIEFLVTARKAPFSAPGSEPGEFFEGLWQWDCAELFLCNPENGYYLELNLAPNGAWWSCFFEAPRINARLENLPLDGVLGDGLEGVEHWEARLRVPERAMPPELAWNPAATLGNVTFSLGSAPRQRYFTHAAPVAGNPDFHRPDAWLPLKASPCV